MNCKSNKKNQNCSSKKADGRKFSLAEQVADYRKNWIDCYKPEDAYWADPNLSWLQKVERAWRSQWQGKMYPHQCRPGKKRLEKGLNACKANFKQHKDFNNFEDIYNWIESITKLIDNLGPITTYDVARRLGASLGLNPKKVYLHGGSAKGAIKLGIRGKRVPLSEFPKEIQELGATHAENFLCIYYEMKYQVKSYNLLTVNSLVGIIRKSFFYYG